MPDAYFRNKTRIHGPRCGVERAQRLYQESRSSVPNLWGQVSGRKRETFTRLSSPPVIKRLPVRQKRAEYTRLVWLQDQQR